MKEKYQKLLDYFMIFLGFGFIGWVYEVCIVYFEMHLGFVNRGFLFGPCLPIYGFGGLLILLTAGRFRKHPLLCFLLICLVTTGTELLVSYLMEWWMGKFLWDYRGTGYGPTFQGRIALKSSLQFGLIGMAAVYVVHPFFAWGMGKLRKSFPRAFPGAGLALAVVFACDVLYHLVFGSNAQW